MSFSDPENVSDVLNRIRELPTIGDIKLLIDEIFPKWIITATNSFSNDYPHLNTNWATFCSTLKTLPSQILIVKELNFGENHKLIRVFTELATQSGFAVREMKDYGLCSVCCKCIPTSVMYNMFVQKGIQVPSTWDGKCTNC